MISKETNSVLHISSDKFFENLPDLLRPEKAASVLGVSRQTIYDWRYRQKQRNIPPTLFLKINRLLYVRTDVLKNWIALQNALPI